MNSDRDPVGGPVTGALETIPLDKGFDQVDGMSVFVLPIAAQATSDHTQEVVARDEGPMPGRILTQQGADLLEIRGADAAALEEGIGVHLPQGLRQGKTRVQH